MTAKFWLATRSTTATLCLLGIGANTALGIEALISEGDGNELDECATIDTLALDSLFFDAIAAEGDALNCNASLLENAEVFDRLETIEFEEFADPAWQEESATWETAAPADTETEWDSVPDAVAETSDAPELAAITETTSEIPADTAFADEEISQPIEAIDSEWDNVPDAAAETWDSPELAAVTETASEASTEITSEIPADTAFADEEISQPIEAIDSEWDNVPDAAAETWQTPATAMETEIATRAEWETVSHTSLKEWDAPAQNGAIATEWDNVPDAAAENWNVPVTARASDRPNDDNALSETEAVRPAIATTQQGEYLEDDPQFQAVLEPETVNAKVAKLAPEDLIRDDRQISELIAPTPEQQRAKTTGLRPEEVVRAARDNTRPEITTESTASTPLLDRLDTDLRRLRAQAETVSRQSLNVPAFASQTTAFETYRLDLNDNLGVVPLPRSQWLEEGQLAGQFNFGEELALENEIEIETISYAIDPQLFARDLSELGLETFDTKLSTGDAIAVSLFLNDRSFENFSFEAIEIDFDSLLAGWENAIGDPDLTALIPTQVLSGNANGEIPDLNWQREDIFAIESEFEALPELNFGNHPFEFGLQRDFLRASLLSPSKKSI
ncbi:MAG: hypothetical protein AAGA60_15395 [Cyanobacteria bacterium P01_E01_bin.42]